MEEQLKLIKSALNAANKAGVYTMEDSLQIGLAFNAISAECLKDDEPKKEDKQ